MHRRERELKLVSGSIIHYILLIQITNNSKVSVGFYTVQETLAH